MENNLTNEISETPSDVKKMMFTCPSGKAKFEDGMRFWGWDDETNEDSLFQIEVETGAYEEEDVGLYVVNDIEKVKWIIN